MFSVNFFLWRPTRASAISLLRFRDHTQWHTTVVMTPLDEWSARRRDLHLTTNNTQWTDIYNPCTFLSQFLLFFPLRFFRTWFFVFVFLACFFVFPVQHTPHTSIPPAGFFYTLMYSVCTSSVLASLFWLCPVFCLLSVFSLHNTNILAPGGIRIRNPSKRGATSARHIPRGHWTLLSGWMQYPNAWLGVHLELNQPEHFVCRGS